MFPITNPQYSVLSSKIHEYRTNTIGVSQPEIFKQGYGLVVFPTLRHYYVKRSVNLPEYVANMQRKLRERSSQLPGCVGASLKRADGVYNLYYINDVGQLTGQLVRQMFNAYNFTNIITTRGFESDPIREIHILNFGNGRFRAFSCESCAVDLAKKQTAGLREYRSYLRSRVEPMGFTARKLLSWSRYDSFKEYVDAIRIVDCTYQPLMIDVNDVGVLITEFNEFIFNQWINIPTHDFGQTLKIQPNFSIFYHNWRAQR